MKTSKSYDTTITGAGAGGLPAAAGLTAAGKKVMLLESVNRVGGRAGSEEIEGFIVNIGAIAIKLGSTLKETFCLLDVPLGLRDTFPAFSDAKILSIRVMRDHWPAQRSCAGFDMPRETLSSNLWHAGDAAKDYDDGGAQVCAPTTKGAAKNVIDYQVAQEELV